VGTPEGKRSLTRPSRLWENNIKVGLIEKEWEKKDHILLVQGMDK
jgi:hypothetical protein